MKFVRCFILFFVLLAPTAAVGSVAHEPSGNSSITDNRLEWPSWEQIERVVLLKDYNTRIVVLGATMLGIATGIIGSFMLLRQRALMGDALSHATLPGIAGAFILMAMLGGTGKNLFGLLLGAVISGVIGVGAILLIRNLTRLKEDAALGIVLSVFFGIGMALTGVIQQMTAGHAAGLESFIYGKTASMVASDAWMILIAAGIVTASCLLLFKEFRLLCFDQSYAASQGWPVTWLDIVMMTLVTGVTVIGLQAVGLILIIALLIIPPAAARFWTEHLSKMIAISAVIGAVSGTIGAVISALMPRLPAGAVIVLVASAAFLVSMVFGSSRGVLKQSLQRTSLNKRIALQHLLRALFEWQEDNPSREDGTPWTWLLQQRSWNMSQLRRVLNRAMRGHLVYQTATGMWKLTEQGLADGARICRNHRLWELYLIQHADIAPSHVDRGADQIEHVLGTTMVDKLEALLEEQANRRLPPSPHALGQGGTP